MISNIEGVGGEVIQFFVFLGVLVICFLLWLSTRVRNTDEPFFSTVYVLERRYGRNRMEEDRVRMSSISAPPSESTYNYRRTL